MQEKTLILNSYISVWNLQETVDRILGLIEQGGQHYVCVSNVHTVVTGVEDPDFAKVTNTATLATADGVPLIWASQILSGPKIHGRASGPDVLRSILEDERCKKIRHYFFGSTPPVLNALSLNLKTKYPQNHFVGFYSPPMRNVVVSTVPLSSEELEECQKINAKNPDIVWVGLGAPKQEIWMYRVRPYLKAPVLVGVGAAFDFLSDHKKRAPVWMQKAGLEWFHRMVQEPHRLASRYFKTNPKFVISVARQAIGRRPSV